MFVHSIYSCLVTQPIKSLVSSQNDLFFLHSVFGFSLDRSDDSSQNHIIACVYSIIKVQSICTEVIYHQFMKQEILWQGTKSLILMMTKKLSSSMQEVKWYSLCVDHSITMEFVTPNTPRQNSRAEKTIHNMWQRAMVMMVLANMAQDIQSKFLAEAAAMVNFLENLT